MGPSLLRAMPGARIETTRSPRAGCLTAHPWATILARTCSVTSGADSADWQLAHPCGWVVNKLRHFWGGLNALVDDGEDPPPAGR
eukprot:1667914-Lingulodinium_polyedra.AAC.1